MSKAERTTAFIIEKSAPIFNTKGYVATSLSDILEATGLTKGAIYGNFEDKDQLAIAVYKHNYEAMQKRLEAVYSGHTNAYDKLRAFTQYYRDNWKKIFERGGCPVLNASIEADDNVSFLKKPVQQSIKSWIRSLAGIIEAGVQEGTFKKDIPAEYYAHSIIMMLEGGVMLSKIMSNQQLLYTALDRIDAMIDNEMKL